MAKMTVRERLARRKATVPKAGPKKRRAKAEIDAERKARAVAENTRALKKAVRKSGKVRQYGYAPAKKNGRAPTPFSDEAVYVYRTPDPLSPEAKWAEDCPDGVAHLDWMHLMPGYPASIQREIDATTIRTGPLAGLSSLQRQIAAELYYRSPLSHADIARALNITPGAVRASMRYMVGAYWREEEGGWELTELVNDWFEGRSVYA